MALRIMKPGISLIALVVGLPLMFFGVALIGWAYQSKAVRIILSEAWSFAMDSDFTILSWVGMILIFLAVFPILVYATFYFFFQAWAVSKHLDSYHKDKLFKLWK